MTIDQLEKLWISRQLPTVSTPDCKGFLVDCITNFGLGFCSREGKGRNRPKTDGYPIWSISHAGSTVQILQGESMPRMSEMPQNPSTGDKKPRLDEVDGLPYAFLARLMSG